MSIHPIYIRDVSLDRPVEAELDDDLPLRVLTEIEDAWSPFREIIQKLFKAKRIGRDDWPESLHWDWATKGTFLESLGSQSHRVVGLRRGQNWEGAMIVLLDAPPVKLPIERGGEQVYVDYIEVAPWNWNMEAVGIERRFGGIGRGLMRASVELSNSLGRNGRISLHSLPQAESVYRAFGFEFVEIDSAKENLAYYELSRARAELFLRG